MRTIIFSKHCFCIRIFLISFLLLSLQLFAANSFHELKFKQIGLKQGLSNLTINSVCQDYQGFIWIGTAYGLNRYDGYEMVSYYNIPGDSTSLMNNEIKFLYEDNQKRLWIGASSGINLYERETDSFRKFLFDGVYYIVFSILQDRRGMLWVGTIGGLYKFSNDENKFLKVDLGKFSNTIVRSLFENTTGDIWIGTEADGILLLQRDSMTLKELNKISNCCKKGLLNKSIRSISLDNYNNYWIATYGNGVVVLNKKLQQIFPVEEFFEGSSTGCFCFNG